LVFKGDKIMTVVAITIEDQKPIVYTGLSSDTKPTLTVQESDATFIETDTGDIHAWSGDDWYRLVHNGVPMVTDPHTDVADGKVVGHSIMSAMGERESMSTTAQGEDIWRGNELSAVPSAPASTTTIPTPAGAGEQMTFISENNADNGATATGVLTLRMEYLDASGDEQTEDITMNGTTGVDTTATDIRFINDLYSLTVGSNGVAEGNIRVYKKTDDTLVYNMIHIGGNKSLVPHRMVPNNKALILKGWHAEEAQGRRVNARIRSTDMSGTLIPGVFCFKGTAYVKQTTSGELALNIKLPALSIVKVSGWAAQAGAEVGCGWWGTLVDN
jgi:hypothetical protein